MKRKRLWILFVLLAPLFYFKPIAVKGETEDASYYATEILGKNLITSRRCWNFWLQPGSLVHGRNSVNIIDGEEGKIIELKRIQGGNDGGAAGIVFPLNIKVSNLRHLHVKIRGEILYERGGNIANWNPRWFPEGALQISITYLDKKGNKHRWYHGFYNNCKGNPDKKHFSQKPISATFTWQSPDLLRLKIAPNIIRTLKVYGFGWEFKSRIYYVGFMGEQYDSEEDVHKICLLIPLKETPVFFYPSYTSKKFGTLNPAKKVEVLSFSKNGSWVGFDPGVAQACNVGLFRLRWTPLNGTAFLSGDCRNIQEIEPPQPKFCFIGGMKTKVFRGPGEKYGLKGILNPYEYAQAIFKTTNGWIFINMDVGENDLSGYGWIKGADTCFQGISPCDRLPIKAYQNFSN